MVSLRVCISFLFAFFFAGQASAVELPLEKQGGVYTLPVRINGVITLNFILDSGASEVTIPADVMLTLLRTGTIKEGDFLPGKTYSLADGSTLKSPRFLIRELELGGTKISNVPASVAPAAGDLLLGQSLLERLDSWALDNKRHVLIVGSLGMDIKQSGSIPSPISIQTGLSQADEESIKRITRKYYDSVQKKDVEGAMNCYAAEKRPQIKRSRIEAVAKDTEYYKIESITVLSTEADKAKSITMLTHKKHDLPPESWEITLEMIKERGEWKIWATPGKKLSSSSAPSDNFPNSTRKVPESQGKNTGEDREYLASFDGQCDELNIGGAILSDKCSSPMLQILNKHRTVMFTFGATGEGMLTFEGWEESHLQSDLYLLKVEKVVHLKGENRTDIPVEGQCTISGDFHKNALITCNATSLEGKNPFHAVFKMTSPPKITYGDKLEPVTVSSSLGQADEEKYVDDRIIEGLTKVRDQRIPLSPTKTDIIVAFSLEALPKIIKLVSQNDMEALAFMFRAEQNGMAIKPGVKLYVEAFNVITILGRSCVAVQVRIKGNPMPLWTTMRMLDVAISKLPKDLGL